MKDDFIFTQTQTVVMTMEKTVTVVTQKLESVDQYGRRKTHNFSRTENVDIHDLGFDLRRAV